MTSVPPQVVELLVAFVILCMMSSTGVIDSWDERSLPRADDLDLVSRVAARLMPPSTEPYNLLEPDVDLYGQNGQVDVILALTRNKTGGVFIETGAFDGEQMSNTLLLERNFGWEGVLIEPSKTLFPRLLQKHRRAWALNACCSQTGLPFQAVFRDDQAAHGLSSVEDGLLSEHLSDRLRQDRQRNAEMNKYSVECLPLYSVLLALNRTSVDFFSLDIEGMEMGVLVYLPWNLLDIKIVLVEFHMGLLWNPQTDQMRWFMEQQGYLAMRLSHDWIFVKRDSEFAHDAERIIRRVRHELTLGNDDSLKTSQLADSFND